MKTKYKIVELLIYIVSYAIILLILSFFFNNTIQLDNSLVGFWTILASTLILILNKTIKPFIVKFTIPLTGVTLGLFYPLINVVILFTVNFIMGNHFNLSNVFFVFILACLISLLNVVFDIFIIKPILKEEKK